MKNKKRKIKNAKCTPTLTLPRSTGGGDQRCGIPVALLIVLCSLGWQAVAQTPQTPTSPDGSVQISLFAAEPDIVTPIGATVDSHGRLLVIESNSHFRPKDYKGPLTDRIRVFEDTKGTGKADRITTFFEGVNLLMNLVTDRDGSILVSSRNEIFRLEDHDGAAGQKITLAHLETKSDYPHDGLHGLAVDRDGNIYFGIGENLGGPWTLVGTDGRKLSDDTGSGAVFRVDAQGRGLTLIAHGFWNPFGLGLDPNGTLWAVDNDPDGRPPCRLIQVVRGGDYGFEFRYGRTGLHPLQCWDGELPGTLGMVAGVGEAPCAVLWNRGQLLVSSWRDHQVQGFALTPRGASYTATMQPLVVGGESFRPVGLASAPDGSIFATDWASSSYPLHGKGRIWKFKFTQPAATLASPVRNSAMERAERLRQSGNLPELLAALDDADPVVAQAAQFGLSRLAQAEAIDWTSLTSSAQRIGLMAALLWRGADESAYVTAALKDPDDRVRQMAVRVIAERGIKQSRAGLEKLLGSESLSPRLLGMTAAALAQLDGDRSARIDPAKINGVLLARLSAPQTTDPTRALALHMLQANHPRIAMQQLDSFLKSPSRPLQLEAVRYLNADSDPARFGLLAQTASDSRFDAVIRAEAIIGLADDAAARVDLLIQLARSSDVPQRQEALRSLRPVASKLSESQRQQLADIAREHPTEADLVDRALGKPAPPRPPETNSAAWQKIVDQAPGDVEAGRRIFFHPAGPGCYRCHMLEGRGRAIGPDLTMIGHSQTPQHVLESILDPSKEIAPLYTLWTITTKSGQKLDGVMLLRRDGQQKEVYADANGKEITVPEPDVADRKIRPESLMPSGLVQAMTDQELRDLMAMLMQHQWE